MQPLLSRVLFGCLCIVAPAAAESGNIVQTLDDIPTWVGSGSNRTGLVIDWGDGRDPLAWGYRWNETDSATAETLLRDVYAADQRLFVSLREFAELGAYIESLGYDRDGDGFSRSDPDDSFGLGSFFEFWEFFTASASPYEGSSDWISSDVGVSSEMLVDGNWIGFRYDEFYPGPGPRPVPAAEAVPEPSSLALLGGSMLAVGVFSRIRRKTRAQ